MSLYIIDDHPLVRQAIAMLLRRMKPAAKVVELEKFSELQAAIIKNGTPELFVLDLLLPGVKGTSAVSEVKGMYGEVPLVVISSMPAGEAEETCIEAGADLYIEKSTPANEISAAIQGLFAATDGNPDEEVVVAGDTKLSKRQKQLIIMLDRGLSNRDIATELDISEHTVKVHLWRLFRRLNVKSRTQTLHFARMNGLL
ncbi:DNA-binding response regulator [Limnohabitans sp. JirII-29]|jgi:DNA-binding NarL/FixJ family response regulator|uniref:response regulator transcription factor n=1 Tax=unclassified Limnohabitans TaxID=2626134 RepID=UPI000C1EB6E4|nr:MULTISPECIES: response regulator transcription factor [unclassified Limnohabitans]PIT79197.1 DNA-binding response regulator [Limnohabitans sp. JirII-31]PUE25335.1 DNA-binding response regulator [Limnohabitans sp. JirII-29]